jgi:hypothetical protein
MCKSQLALFLFACACGEPVVGVSSYAAVATVVAHDASDTVQIEAHVIDCGDGVRLVLAVDACDLRGTWATVDALVSVGGGAFRAGSFTIAPNQTCTLPRHGLTISSGVVKVNASGVADVTLGAREGDHDATLSFSAPASGAVRACPTEPAPRQRRSPM